MRRIRTNRFNSDRLYNQFLFHFGFPSLNGNRSYLSLVQTCSVTFLKGLLPSILLPLPTDTEALFVARAAYPEKEQQGGICKTWANFRADPEGREKKKESVRPWKGSLNKGKNKGRERENGGQRKGGEQESYNRWHIYMYYIKRKCIVQLELCT